MTGTSSKNDVDLQQRYTVSVKNRYDLLCQDDNTDEDNYDHFITAIDETGAILVPKIKKKKRLDFSNDVRVCQANNDLVLAKNNHQINPTIESGVIVQGRKVALANAYNEALEEYLVSKIRQVKTAHDRCKNKESWTVINDITGRKNSKPCLIRGNSPEERKSTWLNHFRNLLGQPPENVDTIKRKPT